MASSYAEGISDWNGLTSGLIGAVVGGLIAGLFSLWAVNKQVSSTRLIDKERLENEIEGIVQAICDEIETIYNAYESSGGKLVEELGERQGLLMYYYVDEDYFTMYNSNASVIGKIKDKELRSAIVTTYNKAKMLLDSFRLNNRILSRYDELIVLSYKGKDQYDMALADHERTKLVVNAAAIKKRHNEAKESVLKLLKLVDERRRKSQ